MPSRISLRLDFHESLSTPELYEGNINPRGAVAQYPVTAEIYG